MSPDGRLLAGSDSAGLVLLDAATGELRLRLEAGIPGGSPTSLPTAARSPRSAIGKPSSGRSPRVPWWIGSPSARAGGRRLRRGRLDLYSAGADSALRQWDLEGQRRFIRQVSVAPSGLGGTEADFVQPAPGGDLVGYSTTSEEGPQVVDPIASHVRFLDVRSGTVGASLDRGAGYRRVQGKGSWHPDGVHFALATGRRDPDLERESGRLTGTGRPSGPYISEIDYSTDGSRLVIAELSGRVTMLDPNTMTAVGRPVNLDEPVCCVSAGPDNQTAIVLTGRWTQQGS